MHRRRVQHQRNHQDWNNRPSLNLCNHTDRTWRTHSVLGTHQALTHPGCCHNHLDRCLTTALVRQETCLHLALGRCPHSHRRLGPAIGRGYLEINLLLSHQGYHRAHHHLHRCIGFHLGETDPR